MIYFEEKEFACKNKDESPCDCGKGYKDMSPELLSKLVEARKLASVSFKLNSAYRCPKQNARVGGSDTSSHLNGTAVDIRVTEGTTRFKTLNALYAVGFNRVGIAKSFIHVDVDPAKPSNVTWVY